VFSILLNLPKLINFHHISVISTLSLPSTVLFFNSLIALRYGWSPQNIPSNCTCSRSNRIKFVLSYSNRNFPTIHRNDIRNLLSEVSHNVSIEPFLHAPLSFIGESFSLHTANCDAGAHLDIKASGL